VTSYARFNVFSIVYGVAYLALFFYSEQSQYAFFRYYPVLGGFYHEAQPLQTSGPAILWYSWLFGAAVIAVIAALIVPSSWSERLGNGWVWAIPAALLIVILFYERHWFY
jgi:hypothetical protein